MEIFGQPGKQQAIHPPLNFGDLPAELSRYETAPVVVWPVPLERTTTYKHGTSRGPDAIIEASRNMETYDEELGCEVFQKIGGIATVAPLPIQEGPLEKVMADLHTAALQFLSDGKFFVMLGGEHSITAPAVAAAAKRFPHLSVLQIDAHADLRDAYQQNKWSHASAMRRVVEICPAVQVGIRAVSSEEAEIIPQLPTKIFWAKDIAHRPPEEWVPRVVESLTENVYLTVDLDGFDPAYVPATGTPEPGGLNWHQVTSLIRDVARKRKIVSMDVVELLPQPGDHASDFLAAKLIYKTLGYIFLR